MSLASNAGEDRAAELETRQSAAPWRVAAVAALDDYVLEVTFLDGTQGKVRMAGLVESETAGVFAALRDRKLFKAVYVDFGAVTWPGELDIAPDAMYDEIKKNGEWILD